MGFRFAKLVDSEKMDGIEMKIEDPSESREEGNACSVCVELGDIDGKGKKAYLLGMHKGPLDAPVLRASHLKLVGVF